MTEAFSGIGTKVYRQDPSAGWETFAEIFNMDGPNETLETYDATSFDSTDYYMEVIPGLLDGGEVSWSMNFTHASYAKAKKDKDDRAKRNFKAVLPNTAESIFSFSAYVTNLTPAIPTNDKVTATITMRITGKTEFYKGSTTTTTTS